MNRMIHYMEWFFHLNKERYSLQKTKQNGSYDTGSYGHGADKSVAMATRDRKW